MCSIQYLHIIYTQTKLIDPNLCRVQNISTSIKILKSTSKQLSHKIHRYPTARLRITLPPLAKHAEEAQLETGDFPLSSPLLTGEGCY